MGRHLTEKVIEDKAKEPFEFAMARRSGLTFDEIAREFGVRVESLVDACKRNGVPIVRTVGRPRGVQWDESPRETVAR